MSKDGKIILSLIFHVKLSPSLTKSSFTAPGSVAEYFYE